MPLPYTYSIIVPHTFFLIANETPYSIPLVTSALASRTSSTRSFFISRLMIEGTVSWPWTTDLTTSRTLLLREWRCFTLTLQKERSETYKSLKETWSMSCSLQ
jgi:hypothetical protein